MRTVASWLALAGVLVLPACAQPVACTEIAAPSGITVTVERDLAPDLADLSLTVCVEETCTDHVVALTTGYASTQATCGSPSPDGSCSGIPVPDGTSTGFLELPELPAQVIKVSATGKLGSSTLTLQAIEVKVSQTFPNGSGCPAGGNQGAVRVGTRGLS